MLGFMKIFLTAFASAAFIAVFFQLYRGEWAALVFSRSAPFEGDAYEQQRAEADRTRWAAPVALSAGISLGSLLLFGVSAQLGWGVLQSACSIICDIAMVAFAALVVRLYLKMGVTDDKKARFRTSNTRTSLFVIVSVLLLLVIALLY